MTIDIRKASRDDLMPLQKLAVNSFIATYAEQNPPNIIEPYIEKELSIEQLQLELEDSENVFFVATDGANLTGYLKLRTGNVPDCISSQNTIEIERIYADPERKRQGIGSNLLKTAIKEAKSRGYTSVWLGVFQNNTPSIDFYQAQGFKIMGEKIFMMDSDPQKDYVMMKAI